jgi:uncharacterized damage-inducible protein DinB
MLNTLSELFGRELHKLEEEIKSFSNESLLWKTTGEIKNSAGNLCLHLCGNMQHFIGAGLGKSGYIRNRDAEFSSKNISREKLVEEIQKTKESVAGSLKKISDADLQAVYPQNFLGKDVTTEYFLIHLLSHFDYHLGQINYLRRIIEKN